MRSTETGPFGLCVTVIDYSFGVISEIELVRLGASHSCGDSYKLPLTSLLSSQLISQVSALCAAISAAVVPRVVLLDGESPALIGVKLCRR